MIYERAGDFLNLCQREVAHRHTHTCKALRVLISLSAVSFYFLLSYSEEIPREFSLIHSSPLYFFLQYLSLHSSLPHSFSKC